MIKIRPPKFELYQQVWFYRDSKTIKAQIVKRWFDFDDDCWWYKVVGDEKLYPENVFERSI